LILVGPIGEKEAMRFAVRSGARDFLAEPLVGAELAAALVRVRDELRRSPRTARSGITVFFGASGGVGTSFVAANVAHRLASGGDGVVLVDLDLVRAPDAMLFDLAPRLGLLEALAAADTLDAHAIDGYAARHRSGLYVIGATSRAFVAEHALAEEPMSLLLQRLADTFDHVVVDAGSTFGPLALAALKRASHVFVVTQQTVPLVRSAARVYRVLRDEIGVPTAAIRVIVNRRTRGAAVDSVDAERAIGGGPVIPLPNDFGLARESVDTGVPLLDLDRSAPLTRAIGALAEHVSGREMPPHGTLWSRALPLFGRRLS
jgi:pilus assembly protein CpaE